MPCVSVIMPVYNASHLVGDAIESIINQTYQDFEFIIYDDNSTDNSVEVIRSYNDPRIVVKTSSVVLYMSSSIASIWL